jgi:hypothetical protein
MDFTAGTKREDLVVKKASPEIAAQSASGPDSVHNSTIVHKLFSGANNTEFIHPKHPRRGLHPSAVSSNEVSLLMSKIADTEELRAGVARLSGWTHIQVLPRFTRFPAI